MEMKRLTEAEIESYRQTIIKDWRTHNLSSRRARAEFPLGEMVSNLAGFAWAWKMKGEMPEVVPITDKDRFNAQGLEGKCVKETNLATAITIHANCDQNRCAVYVEAE